MTDPVDEEFKAVLNALARVVDDMLNSGEQPKKYGFTILMFEFGSGGRMNYISNAERGDCAVQS